MAQKKAEALPDEVCGIEIRSDFPGLVKSPDPEAVIRALVNHGTYSDAANVVGSTSSTLRSWGQRYPEIEEAYIKGSAALGYEAEQTLVRVMRGKKPPNAHPDAQAPTSSSQVNAAKKLLSINHELKDYTQSQTIIRKEPGADSETVEAEVENLSQDELLDKLAEITDE